MAGSRLSAKIWRLPGTSVVSFTNQRWLLDNFDFALSQKRLRCLSGTVGQNGYIEKGGNTFGEDDCVAVGHVYNAHAMCLRFWHVMVGVFGGCVCRGTTTIAAATPHVHAETRPVYFETDLIRAKYTNDEPFVTRAIVTSSPTKIAYLG